MTLDDANDEHKYITEGEIVKIKDKWFKVENCRLNRAYMMPCGSKLFYQILDFVCVVSGQQVERKVYTRDLSEDDLISAVDKAYYNVCCRNACTVTELLQYCPEDQ